MIRRLLIANRAEIAVRIARGAREAGIVPLGIYSDADEHAYHRQVMDETIRIGAGPASDSYLNIDHVVSAAVALKADALHPGYGFLSENAGFAQAVIDAGMIFVGPAPAAMRAMGSKIEAKRRVREHNVPVVPGYEGDDQSPERLRAEAAGIGTPLLIKASAGGGGRGMRVVDDLAAFDEALEAAKREAKNAFGDDTVLLERYVRRPRHIEFQIIGDGSTTLHIGERECSIQRRHQKVIEESPSVALAPALRLEMGAAAVRAAQAVGYTNAGTVEFILDQDGKYYFLEMNARLQVEHPVTEMTYGVDLVALQLAVANGIPLRMSQDKIAPRGWAIETRVYAEDPEKNFLPSSGTLARWEPPAGPGIRVDAGVHSGSEIPVYYDPMLAKIIVWAPDRTAAIARMERALMTTVAAGVHTNIAFLLWIVRDEAFRAGQFTTRFLEERFSPEALKRPDSQSAMMLAAAHLSRGEQWSWRLGESGIPFFLADGAIERRFRLSRANKSVWQFEGDIAGTYTIEHSASGTHLYNDEQEIAGSITRSGTLVTVTINGDAVGLSVIAPPASEADGSVAGSSEARITAPMPGRIAKILAVPGTVTKAGELLLVLEAMKMEHRIEATGSARVRSVNVADGELVASGALLVELDPLD